MKPSVPYIYQPYPKWLYHATAKPRIVDDAAEHAALPPGWFASQGEADQGVANREAPAPVAPLALVASTEPVPAAAPPPPAPAAPVVPSAAEDAEKAELYATAVPKIVDKLQGASADTLERIAKLEAQNPAGPRGSLVKALAAAVSFKK